MLLKTQKKNIRQFFKNNFNMEVFSIRPEKNNQPCKQKISARLVDNSNIIVSFELILEDQDAGIFCQLYSLNSYYYKSVLAIKNVVESTELYRNLETMSAQTGVESFKITSSYSKIKLAQGFFSSVEQLQPEYALCINFEHNDSDSDLASVLGGFFKVNNNTLTYVDYYSEQINTVNNSHQFELNNDSWKKLETIIYANFLRYIDSIKKFEFEIDNIDDIVLLDYTEALARIKMNTVIKEMISI